MVVQIAQLMRPKPLVRPSSVINTFVMGAAIRGGSVRWTVLISGIGPVPFAQGS